MRKAISVVFALLTLIAAPHISRAVEMTWEYSVQVSAAVQASPAQITLSWPQDQYMQPNSYTIYRKASNATSWGTGVTVAGTATSYVDNNVTVGTAYEYQVVKAASQYTGYGYVYAGIQVPMSDSRGKLLLVLDNTHAANLASELARLQQDLLGDGWSVIRIEVNRNDSSASVKSKIKAHYDADPTNVKSVFLFGHVPVPYSGNIVPDGHAPDHQGAWPCDAYYGDMEGTWTDSSVNVTGTYDPRNRNVPGDGKFDQNTFPAPIKLMVGRVDLANMPGAPWTGGPASFPNELDLLRNYLNKDHKFRTKQFDLPRRGIVGDFFGTREGEAFAASGWRNFAPFFGANNVTSVSGMGVWASTLKTTPYLWAYGCGAGSFGSVAGLGNSDSYYNLLTREVYANDLQAVFTVLFGSWLGDWDATDNIMRSVLATPSYGLTCAWSGRPHWFLQHMALGEPIGFSARLTQNNGPSGLYRNQINSSAGQIHVALMGDPTLRLHVVAPPANLTATTNGTSITLRWTASSDTVVGYHVYRATGSTGAFIRLTSTPITGTSYTDTSTAGAVNYMVRAVKLESSASGTYYNPSQGAFLQPTGSASGSVGSGTPPPGGSATTNAPNPTLTNSVVWVEEALPTGAVPGSDGGDGWNWVSSNPPAFSGSLAHQSTLAAGLHQHFFTGASQKLTVATGESLFAYVYLDPNNPPNEVMLQWHDGSWEHRAFWGADAIGYGTAGTAGRRYMGPLPAAGQWVRLEVPASQVGLEGSSLNGMAFSHYGGRATWDAAGKTSTVATNPPPSSGGGTTNSPPPATTPTNTVPVSTNSLPGATRIDYLTPQLPGVGDNALNILTPTLLELKLINTKQPDPARVSAWDLVGSNGQFLAPSTGAFSVTANGQPVAVTAVGFKRRPLFAPLVGYDLRIENSLYLQLAAPVSDNQRIEVKNPAGTLWSGGMQFIATVNPLRYSPAIHVSQEGYMPNHAKKAMVGYYAGNLGEVAIPVSSGFKLVEASSGATVYQGSLVSRPDVGYTYTPRPYQKVYEADFSNFNTPGQYRLVVPGMGGSLPFQINSGIAMAFARTYALGLYHQRCGTSTALPHTRFTHDICHAAPASVPGSAAAYPFTWTTIANYANTLNGNNPPQRAPALTSPAAQLFPFVNSGPIDVSGGHHDAGDYSKYTINSASLIHYLMFAVDSLAGVAALDNLGLPESGDGISDVLQEAKWEADFLAKLQDADGGFYFLVYPKDREYEGSVPPDRGDAQVVWPKTISVSAAAVAALAQCASSPAFQQAYPAVAARYLQRAKLGWQFLLNAINQYGKNGAYQKITHYGDDFADNDELAWAACEMYLATGESSIQQQLLAWFNPADPATWRWGWWHMSQCYGHAIRSYAFAARSGRLSASQLDGSFLAKCQTEIATAGDDVLKWSSQSAYGSSFPEATKAVQAAGWYYSTDQAFDLAVAYQLNAKAEYLTAMVANMNYEGGCNPVNVCYVTGLGWKRQRDVVSQWAVNDRRVLPPSGEPVGNITGSFGYLWNYGGMLQALCYPSDNAATAPYPFYDRWGDSWNVNAEFVILNQARSLGILGFLAAQSPYQRQAWKAPAASIKVPASITPVGQPVTVSLQVADLDLSTARVTWEARDQEPAFGGTFTFAPKNNGPQWVEAEAQWPDGRRVFAHATFTVDSPDLVWLDDALPVGAQAGADGGDAWTWTSSNPAPHSGTKAHQSALASGAHQHYFSGATATMAIGTGDVLYAWVYLDPSHPPSTLMLQWNDGSWEHRAYWGANSLSYGAEGTPGRVNMGPLPAAGQWVQLKVPASKVNLEGSTLNGMAFTLQGGRASWDAAGRLNSARPPAPGTNPGTAVVAVKLQLSSAGVTLNWPSTAGAAYQIVYKNSLTDPTWTTAGQITATGSTTSWVDAGALAGHRRFYLVTRLD